MKLQNVFAVTGLVLFVTASAVSADVATVRCLERGGYTITFNEEDGNMLKDELGADFEKMVCDVSQDLNIPAYETPTTVKVTMSNGNVYDVMVQQKTN